MADDWQLISTARKVLGDVVDLWVVDKTIATNGSISTRGRRVAGAVWSHNIHNTLDRAARAGWVKGAEPVETIIGGGRTIATHWKSLPDAPGESEETRA